MINRPLIEYRFVGKKIFMICILWFDSNQITNSPTNKNTFPITNKWCNNYRQPTTLETSPALLRTLYGAQELLVSKYIQSHRHTPHKQSSGKLQMCKKKNCFLNRFSILRVSCCDNYVMVTWKLKTKYFWGGKITTKFPDVRWSVKRSLGQTN